MSKDMLPFNVTILVLTDRKLVGIKPVTKLDAFSGNTDNFCEEGLFSVSIFGRVGSDVRNKRFSYIDVKVPIFHPIIYNTLISLKRLYEEIITNKSYVLWNDEIKDFERSDPVNGQTGFAYFMEHWKDIEFSKTHSIDRDQKLALLEKYKDVATTTKVIVMPAGLRDMEILSDGRRQSDEINNFYKKLLTISNTLSDAALKHNPEIVNIARTGLQRTFNELYGTIENMVQGKKKLMLGKWASRRIFNGTRNVITAMDTASAYLGAPNNVGVNNTIVGMYQGLKAIMPVARFHIKNGLLSKVFISPNMPARLVDKKTRNMVEVNLNLTYYNRWMSDEGIEKILTSFGDREIRDKPIEIEGHYLGLVYKGPDGTFKVIQDIDDVPGTRSKLDIHPITLAELIYISCYHLNNKYPIFVTRYPIAGVGSIYPSIMYFKTTSKSEQRRELDDNWEAMDDSHVAYDFPIIGESYLDSMVPATFRLKGLVADFDGDMTSGNATYSDESMAEIKNYMNSKRAYVGTDGKFIASTDTPPVSLVLHNLTREP